MLKLHLTYNLPPNYPTTTGTLFSALEQLSEGLKKNWMFYISKGPLSKGPLSKGPPRITKRPPTYFGHDKPYFQRRTL